MQQPLDEAHSAPSQAVLSREQVLALAESKLDEREFADVVALMRAVLSDDINVAAAHLLLGLALNGQGQTQAALDELYMAIQLAPAHAGFRYNVAVILNAMGNTDWAMVEYAACLKIDPDYVDALWNYGELLRMKEHFGAALTCFDRLEQLEGGRRPYMSHRMAVCCVRTGNPERADALFKAQLAELPDPVTHWEYAHFLLGEGRFDEAWPHYGKRFEAGLAIHLAKADYPYPSWAGQYQRGTALLVQGEQGAGDEVLFAAYLKPLAEQAEQAGMKVVVACRTALMRLFAVSFPSLRFVAQDGDRPADLTSALRGHVVVWQVLIGDLPRWFAKPRVEPYLRAQLEDRALMQALLGPKHAHVLRVGLAWSANAFSAQLNRQLRNLNVSVFNACAAAAQTPTQDNVQKNAQTNIPKAAPLIEYYSLQTLEHRAGLASLADVRIHDLAMYLTDFSRTAALIQEMDVVLSVCTSIANVAAAMGADTRVLLHKHGDWRWAGDAAWYAHVKTYRQTIMGEWHAPVSAAFSGLRD